MEEENSGMNNALLSAILQRLDTIINLLTVQGSMGKESFNIDCAEKLYANTNFELAETSEHEVAQTCLRRAKILGAALGLK